MIPGEGYPERLTSYDGEVMAICEAGNRVFVAARDEVDNSELFSVAVTGGGVAVEETCEEDLFFQAAGDIFRGGGCCFAALGDTLYYTMSGRVGTYLCLQNGGKAGRLSGEDINVHHFAVLPDGDVICAGLCGIGRMEVCFPNAGIPG